MKGYSERSLLEFQKAFATEEACAQHLRAMRWPEGFVCPRCGHREAWAIQSQNLLDCKGCRARVSLTAGTIFHKTRTPLLKWYWLLYRMATEKVGVSIAQLQRALEITDYKTAWLMAHKVRKAMADRDARYRLAGLIEMDDAFFGPRGTRRGRGSERKRTVLCAVSLYRDRTGEERPGFAHLRVVEDASAKTIEDFLDRLGCGVRTEEGRQLLEAIRSDGWRAYGRAAKSKELTHCRVVLRDPKAAGKLLPLGPSSHLQRQGCHPRTASRRLRKASAGVPLRGRLPLQSALLGERTIRSPRDSLRVHRNSDIPPAHSSRRGRCKLSQ